ncbi:hypothetical protein BJ912DRAFT_986454 [Pholiota molesta]|nr:hypothetical protein BJ912DRAFT_986454 [Pholiota molesta]
MPIISPFTEVLRTNYVPTLLDIDVIERTLELPNSERNALADQLQQLQEQLETKREMQEVLSRSIAEHHNLLTPFRCLPDDILREVFMACLPTTHEALMNCNEPPLVLGYVCRRWRSVAYHTPRLWATLHIVIPTSPTGPFNTSVMMDLNQNHEQHVWHHQIRISTWLRRSKTCPLSISIFDSNSSQRSTAPVAKSYYELVYNFSDRIWRLDLNLLSHQSISVLVATAPSTSFPHLRVLLLKFHRRLRRQAVEKWKDSGLLNVPTLQCLSIAQCPLHIEEMRVNWSHLTHIIATGPGAQKLNSSDAQKILVHSPRLQLCSIHISSAINTYTPCIAFSLPYLHTLSLIDNSTCLGEIFQYADIPSLRDLTYHSKLCPALDRRSPLLVILSHTNLKLERLTTNIQFYTLRDLVECFDMTPHLTHLTNIHSHKMLSALLGLLAPAQDFPVLLPNLQVIHLDMKGVYMQVSDRELLDFIRSRMDNAYRKAYSEVRVAALTEISFVSTEMMEIDIRAQLADYIAEGMKLNLTYPGFASPSPMARSVYLPHIEGQTRRIDYVDYL